MRENKDKTMKIALIGYGKMGKAIDELVQKKYSRKHEIVLRADSGNAGNFRSELAAADVAIEFTKPEAAIDNIYACFEAKVPVIVGTTGWYGRKKEVLEKCKEGSHGLFFASNFSVGVNVLFEINRKLAKIMAAHPEYRAGMEEIHHSSKRDAPSGTAISFADDIVWALPNVEEWVNEESERESELPIISKRVGDVKGTHIIRYKSSIDTIELKHEAHNRDGFALGALLAAEFMKGKSGVYGMKDLLGI